MSSATSTIVGIGVSASLGGSRAPAAGWPDCTIGRINIRDRARVHAAGSVSVLVAIYPIVLLSEAVGRQPRRLRPDAYA